ncbi:MAG: energy transducer TonB, partial [Candidatus Thiodiazotropha sp.]
IARLTAELERKTQAYAKMPKRKAISASTKEYKYAAYLDAWRRKVERIGNLNYPDQARRDKLYGNLVLHVAVKSDGSVETIRVLHSSGHQLLDDAAVRIVRLAAPFSPFPNEIREETDILDITRTWQFLRSGQLFSE